MFASRSFLFVVAGLVLLQQCHGALIKRDTRSGRQINVNTDGVEVDIGEGTGEQGGIISRIMNMIKGLLGLGGNGGGIAGFLSRQVSQVLQMVQSLLGSLRGSDNGALMARGGNSRTINNNRNSDDFERETMRLTRQQN